MKVFSLLFALFTTLHSMDFDTFYRQVQLQAEQKNYVKFRGRNLITKDVYDTLNSKDRENLHGSLVLVFSKIYSFIYFNEFSGVGISTEIGSYLQFDIKYYETLLDVGIGGDIKAMCVLPMFDKCILLGFKAF